MIRAEYVIAKAPIVKPLAHGRAERGPEQPGADVRVGDDSLIEYYRGRQRRLAWRDWWELATGLQSCSCCELVDRLGAGVATDGLDEVDGVTAVLLVAGPTPPTLVATLVAMHGDRGVVVVVVVERTVPATGTLVWLGELVQQRSEVGARQDVVDRPASRRQRATHPTRSPKTPVGLLVIAASVSNRLRSLPVSTV